MLQAAAVISFVEYLQVSIVDPLLYIGGIPEHEDYHLALESRQGLLLTVYVIEDYLGKVHGFGGSHLVLNLHGIEPQTHFVCQRHQIRRCRIHRLQTVIDPFHKDSIGRLGEYRQATGCLQVEHGNHAHRLRMRVNILYGILLALDIERAQFPFQTGHLCLSASFLSFGKFRGQPVELRVERLYDRIHLLHQDRLLGTLDRDL